MSKIYGKGVSERIAKQIPKSYYDNYYGKGIPFTSDNAFWDCEEFLSQVDSFMPLDLADLTFVDLGAGTGAIVKLMRDFGIQADGYELNPHALNNAEVEMIERDITKPLLKEYDIAFSNAFMYMSEDDLEEFFSNNAEKVKALVMVYPFKGNNDKYRVSLKTKEEFFELGERYGFIVHDIDEGKLIMVQKEMEE